jgi:hypothetical protein
MLDEGVVAEAQDIDLCMILGAGWPFHLGGITPYLDRSGCQREGQRQAFPARGGRQPAVVPVRRPRLCPARAPGPSPCQVVLSNPGTSWARTGMFRM